jgi:phosphoenolpyruvate-protein kinase (PTS system EI component)
VYFRLFDLGTDKKLPFLGMPDEENPSLGWRGARFLLGHPELLGRQARALARASRSTTVNIMYPMIVDLDQYVRVRALVRDSMSEVTHGTVRHGVMFEVPSACLQAREILEEAEFASIGTNDLVQYLFVVDRNNEFVAEDYDYDRPVLWRLLGDLVRAASELGKPMSICGEMGGDPLYIPRLIDIGITAVSVSVRGIASAREAARSALATTV